MPAKTKKCGKCQKRKPVDQFYWKDKARGTRHSYCRACFAARHKTYYQENKQYYLEKKARCKQRLREYVNELKRAPCTDCGRTYPPYVMDFDHLNGEEKGGLVAHLVAQGQVRRAKEEIAKCELVCANCHRIRTHERRMEVVA